MIYAIIPARVGSKGVPGKNIKLLSRYPLIAYSIIASKLCRRIQRTVVSTDSEEIARIALHYGAEVPFLRPAEFAKDTSGDIEFMLHAINWFQKNEKQMSEYLILLRPTTPLRNPEMLDKAINTILSDPQATSLRSAHELAEPPEKYVRFNDRGYFTGLFPNDSQPEHFNFPRQSFLPAYHPNGYIDIVKTGYVLKNNQLFGPNIVGFVTPRITEVDSFEDFNFLEYELEKRGSQLLDYLKAKFPER